MEIKTFVCNICGLEHIKQGKTGNLPKICSTPNCKREYQRQKMQEFRERKAVETGTEDRIGIGKGGGQPKGRNSPSYKNGIKYFHDSAKRIKEERRFCECCGKDLIDADRYHWCVHHIDHDRTNNEDSNFKLLCKRCHQVEHECWKAFEGSTTIR